MVSTLFCSYAKHRLPHLVCGKCSPVLPPGNCQHICSFIKLTSNCSDWVVLNRNEIFAAMMKHTHYWQWWLTTCVACTNPTSTYRCLPFPAASAKYTVLLFITQRSQWGRDLWVLLWACAPDYRERFASKHNDWQWGHLVLLQILLVRWQAHSNLILTHLPLQYKCTLNLK